MVPGKTESISLRRNLHSAKLAGQRRVSRQCWRRELGRRRIRPAKPSHVRQYQSPDCLEQINSTRQLRCANQNRSGQSHLRRIWRTKGRPLRSLSHFSFFTRRNALQRSALGNDRGRRSFHRQNHLGCSSWVLRSRSANRHYQSWRTNGHRWRTRLRQRRDGQHASCLRLTNRKTTLAICASRRWSSHADDLHVQRQAICSDRRRRPRQTRDQTRRLRAGFRSPLTFSNRVATICVCVVEPLFSYSSWRFTLLHYPLAYARNRGSLWFPAAIRTCAP